jgi:AcrR family transcriptional regulator
MLPAMAESGESVTRILDAALRLIVRYGSAKVAMVDVCREAEVSRATLYRCFATREELFAALSARMGEHFRSVVTCAVEADPRVDRRFRVVVRAVNSFVNSGHQHLGALRHSEPEFVLSQFRDRWPEFVEPIRDAIVDAFPPGTTRRHRVVSVAAELIASTVFAQRMLPTGLDEAAVVEVLHAYARSVRR